jgi:hypothetical protein
MLHELGLDFLATPRHAFSQDPLVISHIFAERFLLEKVDARLSDLAVSLL